MANRRIMTIVGARPQFVKAAVLSRALRAAGLHEDLVHTGQHYDDAMSGAFFRQLGLPDPVINLHVGSASHGAQTGRMLEGLERAMLDLRPDTVVVFGDTNSTLAGALAAAKLKIPIAHVEAGMRCGDMGMPEEINRVVTDRLSTLLFTPTQSATDNLRREGIPEERIHLVGDIVVEATHLFTPADPLPFLVPYGVTPKKFVFATIHRAENTDDPVRLRLLVDALDQVADEVPVILCAHPRTAGKLSELSWRPRKLQLVGPADYLTTLTLCKMAAVIATDSGGVQKEAAVHGTHVAVVRDKTEWSELAEEELVTIVSADTLTDWIRTRMSCSLNSPEIIKANDTSRNIVLKIISEWPVVA